MYLLLLSHPICKGNINNLRVSLKIFSKNINEMQLTRKKFLEQKEFDQYSLQPSKMLNQQTKQKNKS